MTRKQQRISAILLVLFGASIAVSLSLMALKENVTYFYYPSDIFEEKKEIPRDKNFRMGGLVVEGSISKSGTITNFVITDTVHTISMSYEGILPDLFREEQGIIATGQLNDDGIFVADTLLAKHDENYMPPEIAKALEKVKRSDKTSP